MTDKRNEENSPEIKAGAGCAWEILVFFPLILLALSFYFSLPTEYEKCFDKYDRLNAGHKDIAVYHCCNEHIAEFGWDPGIAYQGVSCLEYVE